MLRFFKRMERTRNFVLLLFAVVMVVSMIVFYAPTRDLGGAVSNVNEPVAYVSGEMITAGEIQRQMESFAQFGRTMPAKMMLDGLIRERIIRVEAERLDLTATDAEVAEEIRRQFTEGGTPFDQKRYEQQVSRQFGDVATYEQLVRDQLSGEKLQAYITSGVTVSEEEVLDDFKRKNTKFDLTYVPINVADLAQTITPTDEELSAYFEKNKANYRINVPQKKIRYVYLDTAKVGEKLNISEEDLKAEYDKLPEDKKNAGIEAQEIVLRIPKPELEQQVQAKANQLFQEIKAKGATVSEEDFAGYAKGQSESPRTATSGGKLPGLVRENPSNPTDPYQQILKLKEGEITQPIRDKEGTRYFILRRGKAVPKSYEDAKKEIEISMRNRRAYTAAAELAQKMTDRLKEVKDVQKVAEEFASQANMSVDNMVRETGYIKPGDDVEKIGRSDQFEQGIQGLENQNDVGDKIPVQGGFAIPLLAEKKDPRDAELSEVKDQVTEAVKLEQARSRIEQIAKDIAANADSASGLSSAAQAKNLKAEESKSYIVGSPLGQGPSAGTSEALENAIYNLKEGEVTKTPINIGDNWYVVGATKREEASMEDFAKQRDQLIESMAQLKRGQVFSDYLASRRQEMEAKGEIEIYKDVLAQIDAEAQQNQPAPNQQQQLQQQLQQQILQQQQQQQQQAPPPQQ